MIFSQVYVVEWSPFGKELLNWLIFQFGFEGGTVVLIAPVPGHYLPFTLQYIWKKCSFLFSGQANK